MNTMFVYGLLKPGRRLYHVAEPFVVASKVARVKGRLYDAGVPAARFDEDGEIEGFLFELDDTKLDDALRVLDELEDEGVEYRRIVLTVATPDGPAEAWAYEYLRAVDPDSFVGTTWP